MHVIAKPTLQVDLSKCPSSYKENSAQEKLMVAMAEDFRQQYALLYPDHKALLLCPVNECGVQKFVMRELYNWEGCASFVADYFSLELLDPPFALPKQLSSPTWVLQTQRGTCFDFSIVLCKPVVGSRTEETTGCRETSEGWTKNVSMKFRLIFVLHSHRFLLKRKFTAGFCYSTTNENFLSIESVWNHQNYWVNKQDCTFGWGLKVIQNRKAKLENSAPYLLKDGLVTKLAYKDLDCKTFANVFSPNIPCHVVHKNSNEKGLYFVFAFTSCYILCLQVDPSAKPYKNLQLYEILVELMREEENVELRIRDSEKEVLSILSSREKDSNNDLLISIYNPTRNETARRHMEEKERMAKEKKQRQKEKELDLLAPFQVRLGLPEVLRRQDALQLKTDCLNEFKQQLFNKASLIQSRIEKLQKKQLWYQKNYLNMTNEDEDDYLTYCSDAIFTIHKHRSKSVYCLCRDKERAPQYLYLALEEKDETSVSQYETPPTPDRHV
uniref:Coiled-coil domain-containing protein lobo homolog n=1 Tax=Sinocyclocheilus rhinocerous TaxID=307959 RepID=A0A673JKE5_9TELE